MPDLSTVIQRAWDTYNAEQIIETYAILGGMPRNVITVNAQAQLMPNIATELLDPAGGLFNPEDITNLNIYPDYF